MTYDEYRSALMDVAYLASCAVNSVVPDAKRVADMDLTRIYEAAERHLLTGITAMALESAGIRDEVFTEAEGRAIRKVLLFEVERSVIFEKFSEAGIWHMPLKGAVLKDLYPKIGMRQMADNDILIDGSRLKDIRRIMESLGYSYDHGGPVHEVYHKEPLYNFEMHKNLFSPSWNEKISRYYLDIKERLVQDETDPYRFHFRDEDFYIYMIAHEYKHYSVGGTGLRSLLDIYVFCMKKGDSLDWTYIREELEKLGLSAFEMKNRSLSDHLFSGGAAEEKMTDEDREMLDYMINSGAYGTVDHHVGNILERSGKRPLRRLRYVLRRIFLPWKAIRAIHTTFAKYPVLLPFLPFYRIIQALTVKRRRMLAELRALRNQGKTE